MNLSKLALTLLALFSLAEPLASAQDRVFDCVESAAYPAYKGGELMQKVQQAYSSISTISGKFLQNSYVDALEVSEISSGEVWFKKPGLMKWRYSAPSEQVFIVKDSTLWLYQAEARQVIIDEFKEVLISDLPVSFLLGLGDLKKDFRLLKSCQNSNGIVLELGPISATNKRGELKVFKLMVDADSFSPKGAFVVDVGANSTAMILSEVSLNKEIADSTFSADFGSGLDVSDRREERRKTAK